MDDQQRCEQLYRAHADQVHAYARRRSDHQTADEVVAEVFLVAWRRLDAIPPGPLPWLLGVARKTLANQHRASSRAAALNARIEATLVTPAGHTEGDHAVLAALATLDSRDQEVLLLIAWEGLRQEEVGTVLGISRAAVATRLHRARKRLAEALAAQDEPVLGRGEVSR
ncbi:MAG: RNA polymerase sigma factor [Solirubrobacteraceae bacterium]